MNENSDAMKGRLHCYKFTKQHSLEYYAFKAFRERVHETISDVSQQLSLDLSSSSYMTDVSSLGGVHALNLSRCYNITDVSALGGVHALYLSGCVISGM